MPQRHARQAALRGRPACPRSRAAPRPRGSRGRSGRPACPRRRPRAAGRRSGWSPAPARSAPVVFVRPSATRWPPPVPKTSTISSQCGQGRPDMFSTTPTIFWWVCTAIEPARSATSAAACCGVVTTRISAFGHQLRDGDRDVAGARRQVEQQHVQVAPVDVREELLERAVQHRAAPDHRGVARGEHADRDDLHAVRRRRHDHVLDLGRPAVGAQHARHASGRRCPRRPRRPSGRRPPSPPPGSRSPRTCRRRPCRRPPRRRGSASRAWRRAPRARPVPPRSEDASSLRCSSLITSSSTSTRVTPSTPLRPPRSRSSVIVSRIGQPETVR